MHKEFIASNQFDRELDLAIMELKANKGKNLAQIKHTVQVLGRSDLWLIKADTPEARKREADGVVLLKYIIKKETYLICLG